MRKILEIFVKHKFYANLIIAVLLVAGLFSIANMKMSFFPESTPRNLTVTMAYPGASPKEMEEGCAVRIEEAIRGIVGIKEVNSTSSENFARVSIETTGEYDLEETLTDVKNAVDAINSFPVSAERPIVYKQRPITMAGFLNVYGEADLAELKKISDQIERDFLQSSILSQININGFPELEISVEVSEENLLRYDLSLSEISHAIRINNVDISAGMLKSEKEEILIRARSRSIEPNDIADIIIRSQSDGSFLRIRDVGTVKLQFADVASLSKMNGTPCISFQINKLTTENLSEISAYLKQYTAEFNENHEYVKLEVTYDFLNILKQRLNLLKKNGGIGLLLVILCLGLFLSFRLSLWVAWGIPASFLAMFVVANLYGITINMISVFGMILVIGILVDDGIVIAENVYAHFEKGKTPRRAAIDGTLEVMPAVITSITTTIIAFSPLLMMDGHMEFMFEMAFVVIFSLFFSLFEAFLVLPAHLASPHVLRSKERAGYGSRIRIKLDKGINYIKTNIYGKMLTHILAWRYIYFITPLALILITSGLFQGGLIKSTFFPSIPFDQFTINVAFTPGSGENKTIEYLESFEKVVWKTNEYFKEKHQDTIGVIKYSFLGTGYAYDGLEIGSHAGNIFIMLEDLEGRNVRSDDILEHIRQGIGDVPEADKLTIAARNIFGTPVAFSLVGNDLEELTNAKNFVIGELQQISSLTGINDNNAIGKQEILLKLKPKAYFLGLNQNSITAQLRQGFYGDQAQRLLSGKDELRVWVRYPKADRMTMGQLENVKIKTMAGEYPLTELADYEISRGPVNIHRYNGKREVQISAQLIDADTPVPPIMGEIHGQIIPKMKELYPSISVNTQGQEKESQESGMQMMKYFGFAFLIILTILMIHFKSTSHAIIILMMIPLAWIGGMWGHGIEGIPISMLSAFGMIALSGVIINDAVVFLQKYNLNLLEGMKVLEAVYNAGLARFRAILLTTITTTVGLYPIIFEKSFQAQFLKPMAVSLAYGVMIGTFFILVFFPVLIVAANDFKVAIKHLRTGVKPTRESLTVAVQAQKEEYIDVKINGSNKTDSYEI